jgi:hypothetical protein
MVRGDSDNVKEVGTIMQLNDKDSVSKHYFCYDM